MTHSLCARNKRRANRIFGLALAAIVLIADSDGVFAQISQDRADPRRQSNSANVVKQAQSGDENSSRQDPERVDDSYQPKGIELGSFLMLPLVEVDETFNSNVFAAEDNARSDFITRIAPEVQFRSRFPVHSLNLLARAEQFLLKKNTSDNHIDGLARGDGRLDISRDWEVTGVAELNQRAEDRGSPDDVNGKEPTRTRTALTQVGTRLQAGRFVFSGGASAQRKLFADVASSAGTEINNTDRNRWEYEGNLRGAYEMIPSYSAVLQLTGNRRDYTEAVDDQGNNRDSKGYRVEAGIAVDITQLVRGDFLIGYLNQNYRAPTLRDPKGLAFKAAFNWAPSRMTVVLPSLERSVQESTLTRTSSIVRNSASVIVRHELRRNIVLTGTANLAYEEYKGIGRESWTYELRARGIYAFSPEIYVGAEAGYRQRASQIVDQDYKQAILTLRVGVRL